MKSLIIDVAGLSGFGALVGGIYLKYGAATALMAGGAGLLLWALLAAGIKMLINAMFRSNSLENPAVPLTAEAVKTTGFLTVT